MSLISAGSISLDSTFNFFVFTKNVGMALTPTHQSSIFEILKPQYRFLLSPTASDFCLIFLILSRDPVPFIGVFGYHTAQ